MEGRSCALEPGTVCVSLCTGTHVSGPYQAKGAPTKLVVGPGRKERSLTWYFTTTLDSLLL